jgi:hypothetical protein
MFASEFFSTGTDFGRTPSVSFAFGSSSITPLSSSQTQVTFMLPAGYGSQIAVTINAAGQVSAISPKSYFSYSIPTVRIPAIGMGPCLLSFFCMHLFCVH